MRLKEKAPACLLWPWMRVSEVVILEGVTFVCFLVWSERIWMGMKMLWGRGDEMGAIYLV